MRRLLVALLMMAAIVAPRHADAESIASYSLIGDIDDGSFV